MTELDTRALRLFTAVALCLNFRQAAQQLHMTQPPLSRAIRALEERLGVRLFDRDTHGVALTAAGAQLLPKARQILALLHEAEQSLAGAAGDTPARLRLGLTSSVEAGRFGAFTDALERTLAQSNRQLDTSFAPSPRLVAALRAGRLDAALIALPSNTFDLQVMALDTEPMIVALPAGHALARKRRVTLAHLQPLPVYWFERARQPAFFDHCHAVFASHGFAPAFLREAHDHHVLLSDVAAGRGVALLAQSFKALRLAGVCYRPLQEGAELAIGLGLATPPGGASTALLRDVAAGFFG